MTAFLKVSNVLITNNFEWLLPLVFLSSVGSLKWINYYSYYFDELQCSSNCFRIIINYFDYP